MENFNIQEELKKLPGKPGVYLFVDYGLKLRYNAILQGYILKGGFSLC